MTRVVGDLLRAWDIISVGVLISLAILLIALVIARFGLLTATVTWVFGFVAIVLFVCLIYLVYVDGDRIDERTCDDFGAVDMEDCDSDRDTFRIFSYVLIAVVVLIIIGMLFICTLMGKIA